MTSNLFISTRALAVTTALLFAAPAAAQDDGTATDSAETTTAPLTPEEQLIKDLTADKTRLELRNAIIGEQVKLLTPPDFSNNTSLSGDGAGALEATMLGSYVIKFTADTLRKKLKDASGPKVIVVLGDGETPPWGDALTLRQMLSDLDRELQSRIAGFQNKNTNKGLIGVGTATTIATGAQVVAKILSTETTVSSVPFKASNTLFMRMLVGADGNLKRPDDRLTFSKDNSIIKSYTALGKTVGEASSLKPSDEEKKTPKWRALQTSLSGAQALMKVLSTPDALGRRPLYNAARYSELLDSALIARVNTEFSSGSVIKRKGILRTLKRRDPVVMTAGMVVSYTLVDLELGSRKSTGILQCRSNYYGLDWLVNRTPGDTAKKIDVSCEDILPLS